MAIDEELHGFVKDGLARGIPRAQLRQVLGEAGWQSDHVSSALRGFAEVEFAIPVPKPRPYLSAREAFLYMVLFSALYTTAFSLGSLLFQLIDLALPDPAAPDGAAAMLRDGIRWSISFLVVGSPAFLFVARMTDRETRREPSKRDSKVRRWLTYVTLFVAASFLFGDLVGLVYGVLNGDLTVRFVLKVATIGLIAGSVFWYYLRDLAFEDEQENTA